MSQRFLIMTGDDFGYCTERNRGIMEAFHRGSVTRASLLVNAAGTQDAVHQALSSGLPLGLHLNVTEGTPVSGLETVASLLNNDGFFLGKLGFRQALSEGAIDMSQLECEMHAQVQRFRSLTGVPPLYVDGHQHVHVLPGVRDVFARVLHEHSIRSTRLPIEADIELCRYIPLPRRQFYQEVVQQSYDSKHVLDQWGVRYTEGFVGMATMGQDMTVERLSTCIQDAFARLEGAQCICSVQTSCPADSVLGNRGGERKDYAWRQCCEHNCCPECGFRYAVGTSENQNCLGEGADVQKYVDPQFTDDGNGNVRKKAISAFSKLHLSWPSVGDSSKPIALTKYCLLSRWDNQNISTGKTLVADTQTECSYNRETGKVGQNIFQDVDEMVDGTLFHKQSSSGCAVASGADVKVPEHCTYVREVKAANHGTRDPDTSPEDFKESVVNSENKFPLDDLVTHKSQVELYANVNIGCSFCMEEQGVEGDVGPYRPDARCNILEVMAHPGYPSTSVTAGCGEGPDDFAQSLDRLQELIILTSRGLASFLIQSGIHLISDIGQVKDTNHHWSTPCSAAEHCSE